MNNAMMKSDYDMTEKELREKLIGKTAIIQEGVEIKINFLKIEYDPEIQHVDGSYSPPPTVIKISTNGSGWYRIYPCTKIISS